MATTKTVPNIDVSKDTSGRYYKVGGVDDEWDEKKRQLAMMGANNKMGTLAAAGAKGNGQSNGLLSMVPGTDIADEELMMMGSGTGEGITGSELWDKPSDYQGINGLPSLDTSSLDKPGIDTDDPDQFGTAGSGDDDATTIEYREGSQGYFELGGKKWHFVSGPNNETLAWNPETNSLDQSPGAQRAVQDAFKIWEQRTQGRGDELEGGAGLDGNGVELTDAERDRLDALNVDKNLEKAQKDYKEQTGKDFFTEGLNYDAVGHQKAIEALAEFDSMFEVKDIGRTIAAISVGGYATARSVEMATKAHEDEAYNPSWFDSLTKFKNKTPIAQETAVELYKQFSQVFEKLEGITDDQKIFLIKQKLSEQMMNWQKTNKDDLAKYRAKYDIKGPRQPLDEETIDNFLTYILGESPVATSADIKAAVDKEKHTNPITKALDEALEDQAEKLAAGSAGNTIEVEPFELDQGTLDTITTSLRQAMGLDLTGPLGESNTQSLLLAIDAPIAIPKGYMWDKDSGVLRYAVDTQAGGVMFDEGGQPVETGPGRADPNIIASVTQALRLRDQAADMYEQTTGERITRGGVIEEQAGLLEGQEASEARRQAAMGITTEGLENLLTAQGTNFEAIIKDYTTTVSKAINDIMLDTPVLGEGETAVSHYATLESALMTALPPVPPGMIWDDSSQTFKLRAGYEGRDISPEVAQWMSQASPAYKMARRANLLLDQGRQIENADRARRAQEKDADDRFREHMKTGEIDSAEEALTAKALIESADIIAARKSEHLKLAFSLISTPGALVQAADHGLLAKIDRILGTEMAAEVAKMELALDVAVLPSAEEWGTWDIERRGIYINKWTDKQGAGTTEQDFVNAMRNQGVGQLQRTEWMLGPQFRN